MQNNRHKKNNRGFTLTELVVIVLILGILAAIGLPQYQRALESSRVTEAITMLGNIATAEKMYLLQSGEFTPNFAELPVQMPVQPKNKADASYYTYGVGGDFDYDLSGCEYGECTVSALRGQENDHPYEIRLSGLDNMGQNGVRTCHSTDDFGIKICLNVCGVEQMNSDGSCSID